MNRTQKAIIRAGRLDRIESLLKDAQTHLACAVDYATELEEVDRELVNTIANTLQRNEAALKALSKL